MWCGVVCTTMWCAGLRQLARRAKGGILAAPASLFLTLAALFFFPCDRVIFVKTGLNFWLYRVYCTLWSQTIERKILAAATTFSS